MVSLISLRSCPSYVCFCYWFSYVMLAPAPYTLLWVREGAVCSFCSVLSCPHSLSLIDTVALIVLAYRCSSYYSYGIAPLYCLVLSRPQQAFRVWCV